MSKNAILMTLAGAIGGLLLVQGILTVGENISLGSILLLGAITIWSLIALARTNRNPLTADQMRFVQELLHAETMRIRGLKQQIIDQGAKAGDTIPTESILQRLEASKASYTGPDREAYVLAADKLAKQFREKYGPTIPVDVAYKILTEYEQKHGRLED